MLKLLKKLFQSKNTSQSQSPWIYISEELKLHLRDELSGKHKETHLILELRRDSLGKGRILTAFDSPGSQHTRIPVEGIPVAFTGRSHYALKESGMDIDNQGNILIYPCVDLRTEPTPNPKILTFITNKSILAPDSEMKAGAWERKSQTKKPILIENLLKYKFVESVYITVNSIQVELKKSSDWKNHEEKVAETILEYLESLPDPIRLFPIHSD